MRARATLSLPTPHFAAPARRGCRRRPREAPRAHLAPAREADVTVPALCTDCQGLLNGSLRRQSAPTTRAWFLAAVFRNVPLEILPRVVRKPAGILS